MTKKEIVDQLVDREGINLSTACKAVTATVNAIADAIASGENVYLRGLGTFKIRVVAQKTARNIAKNEAITVPAHLAVKFIPAAEVKSKLAKV